MKVRKNKEYNGRMNRMTEDNCKPQIPPSAFKVLGMCLLRREFLII